MTFKKESKKTHIKRLLLLYETPVVTPTYKRSKIDGRHSMNIHTHIYLHIYVHFINYI